MTVVKNGPKVSPKGRREGVCDCRGRLPESRGVLEPLEEFYSKRTERTLYKYYIDNFVYHFMYHTDCTGTGDQSEKSMVRHRGHESVFLDPTERVVEETEI